MSTTTEAPATLIPAYKVRVRDDKGTNVGCLGHNGDVWRLRVYHGHYTKEQADRYAAELTKQNPGYVATAERYEKGDGFLNALLASNKKT
jgi:hypothetical protein